jgi:hypothetical protein
MITTADPGMPGEPSHAEGNERGVYMPVWAVSRPELTAAAKAS